MPRIRCRYLDCAFLDDGYCSAAMVELDPDNGCLTYSPSSDVTSEDEWEEAEETEEWEDLTEEEEDDDDTWSDEEEEEY
jgi:hypothetical protein